MPAGRPSPLLPPLTPAPHLPTSTLPSIAGGGFTNVDPESRRIVPTPAGRTTLKLVYVVLEAQYQSSLATAVNRINTHNKEVCVEVVGYLLEELRDAKNFQAFKKDVASGERPACLPAVGRGGQGWLADCLPACCGQGWAGVGRVGRMHTHRGLDGWRRLWQRLHTVRFHVCGPGARGAHALPHPAVCCCCSCCCCPTCRPPNQQHPLPPPPPLPALPSSPARPAWPPPPACSQHLHRLPHLYRGAG